MSIASRRRTSPIPKLSEVSCRYGAPMGRRDTFVNVLAALDPKQRASVPTYRCYMERLRWVDYDYDSGGAYWGHAPHQFIYRFFSDTHDKANAALQPKSIPHRIEVFIRAKSPEQARALLREQHRYVKFSFFGEADPSSYLIFDAGESEMDRYTVLPSPRSANQGLAYLGCSEGGVAVSMWGEFDSYASRDAFIAANRRVKFSDLDFHTQNHILRRVRDPA